MAVMDRNVVLEALSALTDSTVMPITGSKGSNHFDELNIFNFIVTALLLNISRHTLSTNAGAQVSSLAASFSTALRNELSVDMNEFFDPQYDFDFTNCEDKSICTRGGESYIRPCGWYRVALKVLDKYPDGNAWLGTDGWRSHSVAGEWPVSYHGTSIESAKGIFTSNYRAGPRQLYGRGIYSTDDIEQASGYSKEFISKTNGKKYRVIMQNRINPQMRKVCERQDYWLIEIPDGTSPAKEKEIVEKSIRPYGILLKQV
ncbi:uncharacterized protein [Misgurnus anguillicaudatus]|uniref:uncharacterized protein n=1 Tax=Misgurnus anguillicaudatus TaxID=75329 RepID=UPI003CCFD292